MPSPSSSMRACALAGAPAGRDVVEDPRGDQPLGLTRVSHSVETFGFAGLAQRREVDVSGEVALPEVGERVSADAVARVAGERPVPAHPRVEQKLPLEAVVAGDQEAAAKTAREGAVERRPRRREIRDLPGSSRRSPSSSARAPSERSPST